MGINDFDLWCIYEYTVIKINDYGKDFVGKHGVNGLRAIYMYSLDSPKVIRIDFTNYEYEFILDIKSNYFGKMCVNNSGYVYVLGDEVKVKLINLVPLKTGSIAQSARKASIDKHLVLEFLATEIKEKGQDEFKKLKNPFKFKKYFKFHNGRIVLT